MLVSGWSWVSGHGLLPSRQALGIWVLSCAFKQGTSQSLLHGSTARRIIPVKTGAGLKALLHWKEQREEHTACHEHGAVDVDAKWALIPNRELNFCWHWLCPKEKKKNHQTNKQKTLQPQTHLILSSRQPKRTNRPWVTHLQVNARRLWWIIW